MIIATAGAPAGSISRRGWRAYGFAIYNRILPRGCHRMRNFLAACLLGFVFWLAPANGADDRAIIVFGASSLTNALQDLGDAYTKSTSIPVKFSFAASSALARQIENGAPADVFFSADLDWMDYLQKRNLIQSASRRDVLGNRLVLIAPSDSAIELKIKPRFPLA